MQTEWERCMPTPSTHTFYPSLADSLEELQADINSYDEGGRGFLILRLYMHLGYI